VLFVFSDIANFTALSSRAEAADIVEMLNDMFATFDTLCKRHNLEKLKTVGDAWVPK
jgi:class 3 adenylate cyclase